MKRALGDGYRRHCGVGVTPTQAGQSVGKRGADPEVRDGLAEKAEVRAGTSTPACLPVIS